MNKWPLKSLKSRIHVKHGYPFKGEFFSDKGNHIVLTPGNFYEEGGFKRQFGKEKFYTGEIPEDYLHKKGDLIVAMTEQATGLLGSCAIVPESDLYLHNQRLGLITTNEDEVIKDYIYHLFKTKTVREKIRLTSSGSKVKHTSPERIYAIKVHLPPVDEQKEIVGILNAVDKKIELNNRINAELEAMAKTLYDYWFVQFDFLFDFTQGKPAANGKPYKSSGGKMVYNPILKREIPEGWETQKISNVASIGSGYPFDSESFKQTGNYKVITIKNVQDGSLEADKTDCIDSLPEGIKNFCILEIGDVLLSLTGNVGRLCLVDQNHLLLNQRVGKLLCDIQWKIFFYLYFNRPETKSWLENISTGSSQKNLSPIDAVNKFFVTPPNKVLDEFNSLVFKKFELIINSSIENQQLKNLRDWLLPMLMNGQVTVK